MAHSRALRIVKNPSRKSKRVSRKSRKNPESIPAAPGFLEGGQAWRSFHPHMAMEQRRKLWHQSRGTPIRPRKTKKAKKVKAKKIKKSKKTTKKAKRVKASKPKKTKKTKRVKRIKKMTKSQALVKARAAKKVKRRTVKRMTGGQVERYVVIAPKNVPVQIKSKRRAKKISRSQKNPSVPEFFKSFLPQSDKYMSFAGGVAGGLALSVGAGVAVNMYGDRFGQYKDWVRCGSQAALTGILGFASFKTDGQIQSALKGATGAAAIVTVVDLGLTAVRTFFDGGLSSIRMTVAKSLLPSFREEGEEAYFIERPALTADASEDFATSGVSGIDEIIAAIKSSVGLGELVFDAAPIANE